MTPEPPERLFDLAPVHLRVLARLLDNLLLFALFMTLWWPTFGRANPGDSITEGLTSSAVLAVLWSVWLLWEVVWMGVASTTPGKRVFGLHVVAAEEHTPLDWRRALLRAANRFFVVVPLVGLVAATFIGPVSAVLLATDDKRRTVMDRVASTLVVTHTPNPQAPAPQTPHL